MTLIIGLTGGIASGKTTATDAFRALGVPVIDADEISHVLTAAQGKALPEIALEFGADVIGTNGLKRELMREIVFSDPKKKEQLEAILHPMIKKEIFEELKKVSGADYVILSIPLLVESGRWKDAVARVVVVDVPEDEQISRLRFNRHMSEEEARAIIESQASRKERLAAADDVISNVGTIDDLTEAVAELDAKYLAMARAKKPKLSGFPCPEPVFLGKRPARFYPEKTDACEMSHVQKDARV